MDRVRYTASVRFPFKVQYVPLVHTVHHCLSLFDSLSEDVCGASVDLDVVLCLCAVPQTGLDQHQSGGCAERLIIMYSVL